MRRTLCLFLAAFSIAACSSGVGGVHWGGMNQHERAGVVQTDSSCDGAVTNDPASHCFVARRNRDN